MLDVLTPEEVLRCIETAFTPLEEALRLFSAEIEYSDENVDRICAWLAG